MILSPRLIVISRFFPLTHILIVTPGVNEYKRSSRRQVKRCVRFANLVFASNGNILVQKHNIAIVKLHPLLVETEFFTIILSNV